MTLRRFGVKQEDNLYFYLVEVTSSNADFWEQFYRNQLELSEQISPKNPKDQLAFDQLWLGFTAALEALAFHNKPDTTVWIALATFAPVANAPQIDVNKIEMAVTVTTSENIPFTTHMGIIRTIGSFNSEHKHPGIANLLHSFAAKAMLLQYPEKKFMIHAPTGNMLEILIECFKSKNAEDAIFISDFHLNLDRTRRTLQGRNVKSAADLLPIIANEELLNSLLNELNQDLHQTTATVKAFAEYAKLSKTDQADYKKLLTTRYVIKNEICFIMQLRHHQNNHKPLEITTTIRKSSLFIRENINHFILRDPEGKIVLDITEKDKHRIEWFFSNPLLFESVKAATPLVVYNLEKLSRLFELKNLIQNDHDIDVAQQKTNDSSSSSTAGLGRPR